MTANSVYDPPNVPRVQPSYGYYRQPDGWITVSPAASLDELRYRRKGWEPLTQYGRIEMNQPYLADHPLEGLFIRGGAHELSLKQIIETGMYLNLPLIPGCRTVLNQFHPRHTKACMDAAIPVHFPQLDGQVLEPWPCRFCDETRPFEKARDQHEQVVHKDERLQIRGSELMAASLAKGLKEANLAPGDRLVESQNVVVASASPAAPYVCGFCTKGFKSPVALGKHVKYEHKGGGV